MARSRQSFDVGIEGLNELLRDLRALPKEANAELRISSQKIADAHMAPAWRAAAEQAGPWGPKIAATVKARRDRLPSVVIGAQRPAFSGGGTPNSLRYATAKGVDSGRSPSAAAAFKGGTNWFRFARSYVGPALEEWARAIDHICDKFNTDRSGIG